MTANHPTARAVDQHFGLARAALGAVTVLVVTAGVPAQGSVGEPEPVSAAAAAPQEPRVLPEARASEAERVAVMAKVAPAVCSIMQMNAPGGGSGVIIDPAGFVLTNFHVVGKPEVKVLKVGLPDGNLYKANVLGLDPGSDLAVLLLEPREGGSREFPFAPLGDSGALRQGEAVFAMGNPFLLATDFRPTVTYGIVSGLHRYQPGGNQRMLVYPDCIQVDAPVNPGNSGGPLFNMRGEVVGINGRITVRERGRVNTGVGFAVAANQVRNFLGDLMAGRHAEHGTLDMNAWFMKAPGEERHGVFVQSLFADSVAAKAGIGLGDEILAFNGVKVENANHLATMIGVLPEHSEVTVTYRPQLQAGGYGPPRTVEIVLARLDTGSSRDPDRLASEEHRKLAAAAVARPFGRGPELRRVRLQWGNGEGATSVERDGGELRVERGGVRYVRPAEGEPWQEPSGGGGGERKPLDAEGCAWLERELTSNPLLWGGEAQRALVAGAVLHGGKQVFGAPAYQLALPGDGQRRILLFEDGTPAGYGYRDPVRKADVEVLVRGTTMREVVGEQRWQGELRRECEPPLAAEPVTAVGADAGSAPVTAAFTRVVDKLLPAIVKIHGASGLATIEAYASGVLVSAEGHILSLDLVMMQPEKTRVVLPDGSVHLAKLLPPDDRFGVRMLKIDVDRPLPFVEPATELPPNGAFVVSVGNAYRLAEFSEKVSATAGVLVGRAHTGLRHRRADVDYEGELLLTDAANNPGHYGGGLFTLDGKWIGLNARIVESTETNTELSAAIPCTAFADYVARTIRGEPPAAEVAAAAGPPPYHGIKLFERGARSSPPAYVERVERGSPAAAAGLRPDDLIVRLDAQTIRNCEQFHATMAKLRAGQTVEVTFKRGSSVQRVSLRLEEDKQ